MNKILLGAVLAFFMTAAEAACNRPYIEAAIDQRVPWWAVKFRSPSRIDNICTLCGSFDGNGFRTCVMEEVQDMASRARNAARRF